jgi:hypothetical protein
MKASGNSDGLRSTMSLKNFVLATRAEATAPVPRIGPNAKMKYAFPVANEICTHSGLGVAVRRTAGEQHERAGASAPKF